MPLRARTLTSLALAAALLVAVPSTASALREASPKSVEFGHVKPGATATQEVALLVTLEAAYSPSIGIKGSAFSQTNDCPPVIVAPGGTEICAITVRFAPRELGEASGTLTIGGTGSDTSSGELTVPLSGIGGEAKKCKKKKKGKKSAAVTAKKKKSCKKKKKK